MTGGRKQNCGSGVQLGRLRKAEQFYESAGIIADLADDGADVGDAYVTLLVHAGVAASDVVCCAGLGHHAQGENHAEAVNLLNKIDESLGKHLGALLRMKTGAGYSHLPVKPDERKRALRAATALLVAARKAPRGTNGQ